MRNFKSIVLLSITSILLSWLLYSWGHRDGVVSGLEREYSSVYARTSLDLKLLHLIQEARYQNAMRALSAKVQSDIGWLQGFDELKSEVSVMNVARSVATGGVDHLTWNRPGGREISSLVKRYHELTGVSEPE